MGLATAHFFATLHGALGRGQKVIHHQISINFNYKVIFMPNFVCLLTNVRHKTYQMGFLFGRLGHAPGAGLGVPWRGWEGHFFPKFNQIWCLRYLHEWRMQRHHFSVPAPLGLGEGPKGQISLILNYKVNFKDF